MFTVKENCVLLRVDTKEIIHLEKDKTIRLNRYKIKGFTYMNNAIFINCTFNNTNKRIPNATTLDSTI